MRRPAFFTQYPKHCEVCGRILPQWHAAAAKTCSPACARRRKTLRQKASRLRQNPAVSLRQMGDP